MAYRSGAPDLVHERDRVEYERDRGRFGDIRERLEEEDDRVYVRRMSRPPREPSVDRRSRQPSVDRRSRPPYEDDETVVHERRRVIYEDEPPRGIRRDLSPRRRFSPPRRHSPPGSEVSRARSKVTVKESRFRSPSPDPMPRPGRLIRRQSSLDTFDHVREREGYRRLDHSMPPYIERPLPRSRGLPPPRVYAERDYYDEIAVSERHRHEDDYWHRPTERVREKEVVRTRRRSLSRSSKVSKRRARSRSSSTSSSSSSSSGGTALTAKSEYPKKGKTRIPARLVSKRALIDLGYPFVEEGKTIIVQKALGQKNIDDLLKLSDDYKKSNSAPSDPPAPSHSRRSKHKHKSSRHKYVRTRYSHSRASSHSRSPSRSPGPRHSRHRHVRSRSLHSRSSRHIHTSSSSSSSSSSRSPSPISRAIRYSPPRSSHQNKKVTFPGEFEVLAARSSAGDVIEERRTEIVEYRETTEPVVMPHRPAPTIISTGGGKGPVIINAQPAPHTPVEVVNTTTIVRDSSPTRSSYSYDTTSYGTTSYGTTTSYDTMSTFTAPQYSRHGAVIVEARPREVMTTAGPVALMEERRIVERRGSRESDDLRSEIRHLERQLARKERHERHGSRDMVRAERLSTGELVLFEEEVEMIEEPARGGVRIERDKRGRMSISVPRNR